MFTKMDTNGDGSVDKAEFTAFGQQMAAQIGKPDKSEDKIAKLAVRYRYERNDHRNNGRKRRERR